MAEFALTPDLTSDTISRVEDLGPAPAPVVVQVEKQIGTVDVLGVWGGEELDSFRAVVAPWEEATGGKVNFEGTRDLTAVVTTRVEGGNAPDIAILPNPGFMQQLAMGGDLQRLDGFLNMNTIRSEYSQARVDLGSVDGGFYAIYFKASPKGTVWYNPKTFAANGWDTPATFDEMLALSDQIVSRGHDPLVCRGRMRGCSGRLAHQRLAAADHSG